MPSYPNRCQHIKVNGTQCASPALRRNRFCYFHKRHHDERIELNADRQRNNAQNARARRRKVAIDLPVFEDANSIQVSLMQITRLLISGDIDSKTAGLILYALQTASSNLGRTRFEPRMHEVILDLANVGETALGAHAWDDSDFLDENENDKDETEADEDDGIDPARRAGIMKAAEYLYDLDRKRGGKDGFAPQPAPAPNKLDSPTKPDPNVNLKSAAKGEPKPDPQPNAKIKIKIKKSPARELSSAEVREQIRQQAINAAPALLAANPSLIPHMKERTDTGRP